MSKSHCNGRSAGSRFAQKARLWATASIVALGAGALVPHTARAASFTAGSEAQLDQAIANAIAAGGSSTITLTNDFAVTGPITSVNANGAAITIDMAGHALTGAAFTTTGNGIPSYTLTDGGAVHISGVASLTGGITVSGSTLQVESGGQQTFTGQAAVTGTLGVNGANSALTVHGLQAGQAAGVTTIQIDGGGALASSSSTTLGAVNGAQVNFTVTGAGSHFQETIGTFSLGSAGANAQAAVTVSNGASLTNFLALNDGGATATGVSSIQVTGSGSTFTDKSTITLLRSSLSVQAGGAATTNNLALGSGTSDASLQVSGAGSSAAITSALTVTGTGAGVGGVRVDTGGAVTAGSLSVTGSGVDLESGGQLTVAGATNVTGTLKVSGAGSLLTSNSLGAAQAAGVTTIQVDNGGVIHTTTGSDSFGQTAGSQVNVTVAGAGSQLNVDGSLTLNTGATSTSSITISGGASMTVASRLALSSPAGGVPTVVVTDPGSKLTTGLYTMLRGELEVLNGATANVASVALGGATNTTSTILVSGAGSSLTSIGAVSFVSANNSTGVLTVANGGVVTAGSVAMPTFATRTGVINIGGAEGQAATGAGTLNTPTITFGAGTGRINFNHTDPDYIFAAAISGNGAINQVAGVTHLTGDSSGFTGATTVSGGTLSVDGSLAASAVDVLSGATLVGSGTAGNTTIHTGATIAPGGVNSTLHVNGAFVQQAGSTYQVQVDPTSNASTQIARRARRPSRPAQAST